jgi:hypothetical protein
VETERSWGLGPYVELSVSPLRTLNDVVCDADVDDPGVTGPEELGDWLRPTLCPLGTTHMPAGWGPTAARNSAAPLLPPS